MKSIYPELAHCGSKNLCARTDTVFLHLTKVSKGTVSLQEGVAVLFFWVLFQIMQSVDGQILTLLI